METRSILITDIIISRERQRTFRNAGVAVLQDSIERIGLRTPIAVRTIDGRPHLVTGEHRIQAMLKLGNTHIDAVEFDNEHDAKIWEIDENLARADLSKKERFNLTTRRAEFIAQRHQLARKAPPMPDQRFIDRDEAKAAGQRYYYPRRPCTKGHDGVRYVASGHCVICERFRAGEQRRTNGGEKGLSILAHNAPVLTGGQGQTGGNRAAARELGVSKDTIGRAKIFTKLSDRAQDEAIKLGLASKHHILKYAAAHGSAELQVRALQSAARKQKEKAERKRQEAMTIKEQAAAAAPPKVMPLIDYDREKAVEYWLWLVERHGGAAYAIINRLREVNVALVLEEADKAKADGTITTDTPPKSSLH